jgi:hypothetical protein
MGTLFAASAITSPFGLVLLFLVPTVVVVAARGPVLTASRLVAGYLGALVALSLPAAAITYVLPEHASAVWHIPAERYWSALLTSFLATFITLGFVAVMGISFVGIPALLALAARGKATAPWLIAAAAMISLVVGTVLGLTMTASTSSTFLELVAFVLLPHLICAIGFAVAARLPWTLRPNTSMRPTKSLERTRGR